ncbi:MAG: hypothetical protein FDX21_10885 [Chlorobium sp.]|nr:MAG: hypothetical protein FDX21_10885 [Chlorobium sp.]
MWLRGSQLLTFFLSGRTRQSDKGALQVVLSLAALSFFAERVGGRRDNTLPPRKVPGKSGAT